MMSRRASEWLLAIERNVRLFFLNESMCTLERVMITSLEIFARLRALLYWKG